MKMNKRNVLVFAIFLLFVTAFLVIPLRGDDHKSYFPIEFEKLISQDNLCMTIYYMSPFELTRRPIKETDLISYKFEYKVTIHNSRLEEHIDLLNQINQVSLIWKKQEHYQNVRLCYVFETKKGNKIFSISMFDPEHMFVNGHQVEGNKIFYDVVMPFLPEDAASELQSFLKKT